MWPSFGNIVRTHSHFFVRADGGQNPHAIAGQASHVRAVSRKDAPAPGGYSVLDGAAHRLAFLLGFAKALQGDDTKLVEEFFAASACVRVEFEFIPDDDMFLRRKIQLDEDRKAGEKFIGLHGHKLCLATSAVQDDLRRRNLPCSTKDVFQWLQQIRWTEEAPKLNTISQHLKIKDGYACRAGLWVYQCVLLQFGN